MAARPLLPLPLLVVVAAGLPLAVRGLACRCSPPAACWEAVPWPALNRSVHGRLQVGGDTVTHAAAIRAACAAGSAGAGGVASLDVGVVKWRQGLCALAGARAVPTWPRCATLFFLGH